MSCSICSIMSFVWPYGLSAPSGMSSVIGIFSAMPYTVADELNTIFFTPYFCIQSNRFIEPVKLLR